MAAVLVFAVAFGAFAWTAAPVAGWLDAAELVAASASLGVAHPPGHPLAVLVGRAAMLLPVGDAALRVHLASAAAVALAAAALQVAGARVLGRAAPALAPGARAGLAAAAGLGFAASYSAWFQAVRAEVYGLEVALVAVALAWVLRWEEAGAGAGADDRGVDRGGDRGGRADRRPLHAAALVLGLALANHHLVTLLFLAPLAAFVLPRTGARAGARLALLGVLGLAAYLYLPVRAAHDPTVNWGDPDRADRFAWTVSARAFQKSLSSEEEELGMRDSRAADAAQVTGTLIEQASPAATVAALLGAYLLVRVRRTRRHGLLLAGVLLAVAAGPVLVGFDPDNPDAHGYLLPALAALLLLAAAGAGALAAGIGAVVPRLARPVTALALLAATALPVTQARAHAAEASLRDARASEEWGRAVLDLPPRTLLLAAYYETSFQLWYLETVEDLRPDVTVLDRSLLTYPGSREPARARHPELAPLIDAPLRAGRPSPIALLDEVAARRPVVFELHVNLDPEVLPHLVPFGPVAWYAPSPPPAAARDRLELLDDRRAAALEARLAASASRDRVGAGRLLLWNAFVRARLYCALGRADAAAAALRRARALAPGDSVLDALERDCLGGRPATNPVPGPAHMR